MTRFVDGFHDRVSAGVGDGARWVVVSAAVLVMSCPIGCQSMMHGRPAPQAFTESDAAPSPVPPEDEYATADADVRLDQARSQVLAFIHRLDTTEEPRGAEDDSGPAAKEPGALTPAVRENGRSSGVDEPERIRDVASPVALPEPATDSQPSLSANASAFIDAAESPVKPSVRPPKVIRISIREPEIVAVNPVAASGVSDPDALKRRANVAAESSHTVEPVQSVDGLIQGLEQRVAKAPNDVEAQWRLALLRMVRGDDVAAEEAPAGMIEVSAALLQGAVRVMSAARQALANPVTGVDAALSAVDAFRDQLRERAALTIPTVALCSRVQAFGLYDVLPENAFQPYTPNQAIVYIEVRNFSSERSADGRYRTLLSDHLEVLTPDGEVLWEHEESAIEDFSARRREDFFVAQRIALPTALRAGEYVLKVTVSDPLADKRTQALHRFRVGSPESPTP